MANQAKPLLNTKNIALNIYKLRQERNFTHEDFAEMLAVSTRTVYSWENGTKLPSLKRLIEIALVFNASVDSILR